MYSTIKGNLSCILLLIATAAVILSCSTAHAQYTPKNITKLVADVDTRDPAIPNRTPIILIHGITGTADSDFPSIDGTTTNEKAYFKNLLDYIYTSDLRNKYVVYRFHYLSNKLDNNNIAKGLQEWLDDFLQQGKIRDVKFVVIGHSMGGLVTRSYMEEQKHTTGAYSGQFGGERVWLLITLATPHHGTPIANGNARKQNLSTDWQKVLDVIDQTFWGSVTVTQPNRSDLRWDNYNNMNGYGTTDELNLWLKNLNTNSKYLAKIIAYYSNMITTDYKYKALWDYLNGKSANDLLNWYTYCELIGSVPPSMSPYTYSIPFDIHAELTAASVVVNKVYNYQNDGLVPADSGKIEGLTLGRIEFLSGYDHEDIKADIGTPYTLFKKIENDLIRLYTGSILLYQGWNLISLPIQPSDTAIATVLSGISGKYSIVWAYINSQWKGYDPSDTVGSDLVTMEAGKGYWIKMKSPDNLTITGTPPSTSLTLTEGWNLVGYNNTTSASSSSVLSSISNKYQIVWAYMNSQWKGYDPLDAAGSDLTEFTHGYGYWIKVNAATAWQQ